MMLCPFSNTITSLTLLKDKGYSVANSPAKVGNHYTNAVIKFGGKNFSASPKILTTVQIPPNVSAVQLRQTASFCIIPFQGKPDDYEPEEPWEEPEDDDETPINGED